MISKGRRNIEQLPTIDKTDYTNYKITFDQAVNIQMNRPTITTDKYMNAPAYVSANYLNVSGYRGKAKSNVNVRAGEGTNHHTFGQLNQGRTVTIVSKGIYWHEIKYDARSEERRVGKEWK